MIDNLFTITEASKMIDCTRQNLYQKQDALKKLGYWQTSNTGKNYLTAEGINYLREQRIETIKTTSKVFNQLDSKDLTNAENTVLPTGNADLVNILQEQIKELKEEKDYWRKQTELKDQELKNKNDYIQKKNIKAIALLGTAEDNKKQEEEHKKNSWWSKIFG